jgi:L-alanine-DL-glutamate epimerase-like enolase superfamily enzyme
MVKLELATETFAYKTPFHISGYVFKNAEVLVVRLSDGEHRGLGEAAGVYYHGETPQSMVDQVEAVRADLEAGADQEALRRLLPAGGARNAVDAALWDLHAKQRGEPVWSRVGVPAPRALTTSFTVSAGSPYDMAAEASRYRSAKAIKLKLTSEDPAACVRAVRAARPDVWLGIDANQALSRTGLDDLLPHLLEARVALIEQPVRVGDDAALEGLRSPIPVAADESVQNFGDLGTLPGRYQVVNIKLDKCGGLTEALSMAREARRLDMKVMVGCMSGTSLSMGPAFVLAQMADFVDLDGPIFLSEDREVPALYEDGEIFCPDAMWGAAN